MIFAQWPTHDGHCPVTPASNFSKWLSTWVHKHYISMLWNFAQWFAQNFQMSPLTSSFKNDILMSKQTLYFNTVICAQWPTQNVQMSSPMTSAAIFHNHIPHDYTNITTRYFTSDPEVIVQWPAHLFFVSIHVSIHLHIRLQIHRPQRPRLL